MWHVTYTKTIGEHRFDFEYVAGYVGAGLKVHALDKHNRPLCGCGKTYNRSHRRFAINGANIGCDRCLQLLESEKIEAENWFEETHAEFVERLPERDDWHKYEVRP